MIKVLPSLFLALVNVLLSACPLLLQQVLCLCPPGATAQCWSRSRTQPLAAVTHALVYTPQPSFSPRSQKMLLHFPADGGMRDRGRKHGSPEALQLVWLASTTLVCLRSCRQAYEKELSTLAVYLRHILHIAFPAGPLPSWQVTQLWEMEVSQSLLSWVISYYCCVQVDNAVEKNFSSIARKCSTPISTSLL